MFCHVIKHMTSLCLHDHLNNLMTAKIGRSSDFYGHGNRPVGTLAEVMLILADCSIQDHLPHMVEILDVLKLV